jgi:hypothetical protein
MAAVEAFRTHSNYLRAFATLAGVTLVGSRQQAYGTLAARVAAAGAIPARQNPAIDIPQLRRSLANAWGTELQISLNETFVRGDELVAVSNNWVVIQTYYVFYPTFRERSR